ncbi:MAG: toll/interleukin-1 receptor domain-containing protein [Bacteriovoracaceae bacterium]|nr:toll/interleukin-1 receptor domain-containing protein [Bacteriovoracaceae bacterium]
MVATSNSLHDVYICSGKDDHKVASELCEKLTAANISCFVKPSVFKMDAILARKVTRKIKDARVFVFVFSSLSNENEEILWEIDKALELKKVFITFKMEDACPSDTLAYYIGNTQWMDANSENLSESIRDLQKVLLKVIKQDSDTVVAPNDLKPKKIKRQKSSPVPSTAGYKNLILALVGAVVFAIIIGRYYKYDQIVKKYFIQEEKKELVKETVFVSEDIDETVSLDEYHQKKQDDEIQNFESEKTTARKIDVLQTEEPETVKKVSRSVICDKPRSEAGLNLMSLSDFLSGLSIRGMNDVYLALSGLVDEFEKDSISSCSSCQSGGAGIFLISILDKKRVYGPVSFESIKMGKKVSGFDPAREKFFILKNNGVYQLFTVNEDEEKIHFKGDHVISEKAMRELEKKLGEIMSDTGKNLTMKFDLLRLVYFSGSSRVIPFFEKEGFKFYFVGTRKAEEPMTHVLYGKKIAKFNVDRVRIVSSVGMNMAQLTRISQIINRKRRLFLQKWQDYITKTH